MNEGLCNLFLFLILTCFGCVSVQQQVSESDDAEIEGFVGTVVINEEQFDRTTSSLVYDRMTIDDQLLPANNNVTYEGVFGGKTVYIRNCKCIMNPKIIQNKLLLVHYYGGGESNRESTKLLWDGKYYQNSNGQHIVDVILFSDVIDIRRAGFKEKKILDITALQREGVRFLWINLVGYETSISYTY